MRTSSNRELARRIGVSETAVRRAEKAGRIRREPDGAWNLARVRAAWAANTDPALQRVGHGAGSGSRRSARRAVKPVPEAALGAVRETLREHGEPIAAGGMTFMQARTANEVLKAQERRVRLQRMKGGAWVSWPARIAVRRARYLAPRTLRCSSRRRMP
jgi:hypothetical protein